MYVKALKGTTFCCLEELNNLNLGGDAYLTLFTLIGAHSVAFIDGNKLKNERKCTPRIEKKTKNVCHIQKIDIMVAKGDSSTALLMGLRGFYLFIRLSTRIVFTSKIRLYSITRPDLSRCGWS